MSLPRSISHYRILSKLGEGGMAAVYRAADTKLNRDVAIKILPEAFSHDPDRLARFTREAQVLASLNHPNIAAIYGVEDNAIVMELVEGESPVGPLDPEAALPLIHQLIDALEYAHDKGVVHRDLKPANLKVTSDRRLKVLDFGLAKALSNDSANASTSTADSPTLTMRATQAGLLMGTAAYMSPEQARGQNTDQRSDIWSFGVVLFELLTGQCPFHGETVSDTLAAVLKTDPDLNAVPPGFRRLLQLCLARDRRQRLREIGTARILLEETGEPGAPLPATRAWLPWTAAGLLAIALLAVSWTHSREPSAPEARSVTFQISPPEKSNFDDFALSPDGRFLAFTADGRMWVRPLETPQMQPLAGTEGAEGPFWSPDSRHIAFFAHGKLYRIPASGGTMEPICDASHLVSGSWNRNGVIVFTIGTAGGMFRVPASGGAPTPVSNWEYSTRPQFLPDQRHFLLFKRSFHITTRGNETGIYAGSLEGEAPVFLLPGVSNLKYVPPPPGLRDGHIIFSRGQMLVAQAFDPEHLKLIGDALPLNAEIDSDAVSTGFSVSENGVLAHTSVRSGTASQLVWLDRQGKRVGTFGPTGFYGRFRLSPDEKQIVFSNRTRDLYVLDSTAGTPRRLTFPVKPEIDDPPLWSPDGRQVVWASNRAGPFDLYMKAANGASSEKLLVKMGTPTGWPEDWSRDGRYLIYEIPGDKSGEDLWIAPQQPASNSSDQKPFPYLNTPADERHGRLSPDGRWMAYSSNENGRDEVYVQSFPTPGVKYQVSSQGGLEPQWRRDGSELFYIEGRTLMVVTIKLPAPSNDALQIGGPKPLFRLPIVETFVGRSYEVSNDGQRFLTAASADGLAPPITVVLNWHLHLKR